VRADSIGQSGAEANCVSPSQQTYRELSAAQRSFAERQRCEHEALRTSDDAVCLYREVPHATIRWIVDLQGSVRDHIVLRRESGA